MITAPTEGQTFESGAMITFTGTATDVEDGDLTAALAWASSLDGALGAGGTVMASLSDGVHQISASSTDGDGLTGQSTLSITVGGSQALSLEAGASNGGNLYLIAGSATGTTPGIPAGPFLLPLAFDAYTNLTVTQTNGAFLFSGFGFLDGSLHGDVAVRRNLQALLGREEKIDENETKRWLAQFSPWRALVAAHLWAMNKTDGY